MKIRQIFNNNVILSENNKGEEIILIGRGIAYGLSRGSTVIEDRIEKKFELKDDVGQKFKTLVQDVPYDYIIVAEDIIDYMKSQSKKRINDSIYVTLTDHISNLVERIKMGIVFDTTLLLNIKSLYKEEYKIGLVATEILRKNLKLDIDESEANFIALHIINAQIDSNMQQMYEITAVIEDILSIVKGEFGILDLENFNCDRFITHCRFFAQRVINKEYIEYKTVDNRSTYKILADANSKQSECIDKICKVIKEKYNYEVSVDEKLYIMLHLIKLTEQLYGDLV
ncbi:PRD domain-containing protein [Anaerorhabdus sp.]|uniref:PRD domain-containing protein n=1 Tax=Anaerorhabdus sp. TaxID=1872524 RepID=UPI002B20AC09|nr:PRD domain-containing protein [Anaerorhabdus sp.]MEA4875928.1 PRD domain-containing protein [Anaerorhabdus sp.]